MFLFVFVFLLVLRSEIYHSFDLKIKKVLKLKTSRCDRELSARHIEKGSITRMGEIKVLPRTLPWSGFYKEGFEMFCIAFDTILRKGSPICEDLCRSRVSKVRR